MIANLFRLIVSLIINKQSIIFYTLFVFVVFNYSNSVFSQAQEIRFSLPKVTLNNESRDTEIVSSKNLITEVNFSSTLSLNDSLRFAWSNFDLDLKSKQNPKDKVGYIRAYLDTTEDKNLILEFATSPLKIQELTSRIREGNNKVIFVLFLNNQNTNRLINFSFNYKATSSEAQIKIIKPIPKTVFNKGINQEINLVVENFFVKPNLDLANHGKIEVYINNLKDENFLTQILEANIEDNNSKIKITSDILGSKFENIKDNLINQLIFLPVTNQGKKQLNNQIAVEITTNFQNTLNLNNPQVEFLNLTNTSNTLASNELIKIKISNFKILKFDTRNSVVNNEGYLQIIINDKPHKITFDKNEFSIDELVPNYKQEKINLKLQLVNADFTLLSPPVTTNLDLFLKQKSKDNVSTIIDSSNWQFVIIGLTILLILSSVLYIIYRT